MGAPAKLCPQLSSCQPVTESTSCEQPCKRQHPAFRSGSRHSAGTRCPLTRREWQSCFFGPEPCLLRIFQPAITGRHWYRCLRPCSAVFLAHVVQCDTYERHVIFCWAMSFLFIFLFFLFCSCFSVLP